MKFNHDHLAQSLESELGAGAVRSEPSLLASHIVDGRQPALCCVPETAQQVAAALRICSEESAAVTPWGGGTAICIGNPPRQVDVVIELSRMNRLVEHDDANLTATVEAGMTLADVQQSVARRKQFLAFDPPFAGRATVGGVIATNLNGPRRSCYGSVRDLVIGMKVVLATGEQIKAGGKVVKNVAGYDMCKLFVGSLGTLGIITEATVRMAPIPERSATLLASGTLPQAFKLADEISHSPLLPAALIVLNSRAMNRSDAEHDNWKIAVWTEGFAETVARHLRDAQAMAERIGSSAALPQDSDRGQLWNDIRDFPLQADRLVYRVTVPRSSAAAIIQTVAGWETPEFRPAVVTDALTGTIWIAAEPNMTSAEKFPELISLVLERRGHAVILVAPPSLKEAADVWGPPPPSLALMREIKRQFDPKGLLNPGRFLAGI